jgi:hypothetical protein
MTDDIPDDMAEQLRAVLRQRADVPTVAGDPVAAVQHRMRRRAVRRGIATATTAAVCVAGIAIGATALAGNDTATQPAGPAVGSSNPAPTVRPHTPQLSLPALPSAPASSPVASAAVVSPAPGTSSAPLPGNVSSVVLPNGYSFGSLALVSGQLVLVGAALSTPGTAFAPPACASARISSNPFAISTPATSILLVVPATNSCADPSSVGEQVRMVATETTDPKSTSGVGGTIAIERHDPTTNIDTVGPIVMRYDVASDTRPVSAYGGGSLWIYDLDTSNGPEAIQVSATSGQVEDVVRTPAFSRPIIAANSDGLWLGNSIEGGQLPATVYRVAPGSHTVTTVVPSPSDAVDWMVADQGHVWAGIRPSSVNGVLSLWRFDGPTAKVAFRAPEPSLQAGPNSVVGDEQNGLWLTTSDPPIGDYSAPTDNKHLDVVRLDPNTGKPTVEAQLPPLDLNTAESQTAAGQAAFFAGNYFLLQSPSVGGYTGFAQLLRITPLP